jgi:hypothetical protein
MSGCIYWDEKYGSVNAVVYHPELKTPTAGEHPDPSRMGIQIFMIETITVIDSGSN